MLALELQGVIKRYRAGIPGCSADVDALRGVDLRVASGEIVGVAGAPAAGKSTLLLVAAGALRVDAGAVTWFERSVARGERPFDIAYVPERNTHHGFLTVREVVEHSAALRGIPPGERSQRITWVLTHASLDRIATVRVGLLSAGARKRLGIACAMVAAPRLMLVDDPFADLDPQSQADVGELLRDSASVGATILVASRDTRGLCAMADRVVAMSLGRIHGELDPLRFRGEARREVAVEAGHHHEVLVHRVAESAQGGPPLSAP